MVSLGEKCLFVTKVETYSQAFLEPFCWLSYHHKEGKMGNVTGNKCEGSHFLSPMLATAYRSINS